MPIIAASPRKNYAIYSALGFLKETFPEPDQRLDRYSGDGVGDLIFRKPKRGARTTIIVPRETARNWQSEAARGGLMPRIRYVVAAANSLRFEDTREILSDGTDADGFLIDVLTLAPSDREHVRVAAAPFLTHVDAFQAAQGQAN